jgi:hypothetical protein
MYVMGSVGLIEMYVTVDLETFQALPEPYRRQRMPEERRMEAVDGGRRVADLATGYCRAPYCGVSILLCSLRP